ncbi:hypothetical protein RB598_004197 [Gaeumannomyces tritici]
MTFVSFSQSLERVLSRSFVLVPNIWSATLPPLTKNLPPNGHTVRTLPIISPPFFSSPTMKAASKILKPLVLCLAGGAAAAAARPKIIIENDFGSTAFTTFLQAFDAGWDVLGLVGDTANTWALQSSLHALALLERAGLSSCVPVHKGADYPLLNTPELHQLWQARHGALPWQGVFKPENATAEAAGWDPTSGDPGRVVPEAFAEGYPNGTLAGARAAAWMVEQVRRHPGEVLIYSGGALTNIALAVRMDPEFASLAKGLVVMGGYVDVFLLQTSGDSLQADINSDLNLKIDPEAAKIALTADFPSITLIGNGANQFIPSQEFKDEVFQVQNPFTQLFHDRIDITLPLWDEIALFAGLFPSYVLNSTSFYVDVDTAWSSPFYGNIIPKQPSMVGKSQRLKRVKFVHSVNTTEFQAHLKHALQHPKTGCNMLGQDVQRVDIRAGACSLVSLLPQGGAKELFARSM